MLGSCHIVTNPSFYFPEDVVIEILSRLPVKSLIRFTIVCKTWDALIQSPNFIFKHMSLSKLKPILTFSQFRLDYSHVYNMSLHIDDALGQPITLNLPFLRENDYFKIVGFSNGLFLLSIARFKFDFVICNPSTGQFYKIPSPDIPKNVSVIGAVIGLYFNSNSSDYQLVKLVWYDDHEKRKCVKQAEVYTMSSDSWRKINIHIDDDVRMIFIDSQINSASAMIRGDLYWQCYKLQSQELVILYFDMSAESFGVIYVPHCLKKTWRRSCYKVTQVNEELAILLLDNDQNYIVWTLNEHSMVWSKKLTIELLPIIAPLRVVDIESKIKLLGCGEDGNIIYIVLSMHWDDKLLLYNIESGEVKRLQCDPFGYNFRIFRYTESLFPVKKKVVI